MLSRPLHTLDILVSCNLGIYDMAQVKSFSKKTLDVSVLLNRVFYFKGQKVVCTNQIPGLEFSLKLCHLGPPTRVHVAIFALKKSRSEIRAVVYKMTYMLIILVVY